MYIYICKCFSIKHSNMHTNNCQYVSTHNYSYVHTHAYTLLCISLKSSHKNTYIQLLLQWFFHTHAPHTHRVCVYVYVCMYVCMYICVCVRVWMLTQTIATVCSNTYHTHTHKMFQKSRIHTHIDRRMRTPDRRNPNETWRANSVTSAPHSGR